MSIYLFTDGGIRPDSNLPVGRGYGGQGIIAVDEVTNKVIFQQCVYIDEPTTSQRMELSAAITGLTTIKDFLVANSRHKEAIILASDSAYMVNCIKNEWWYNWAVKQGGKWLTSSKQPVENADLWRELLGKCYFAHTRIAATFGPKNPHTRLHNPEDVKHFAYALHGLNVTFEKVKGHKGRNWAEQCNESADMLATRGKNGEIMLSWGE